MWGGRLLLATVVALIGCIGVAAAGMSGHNPTFTQGAGSFYAKCFLSHRAGGRSDRLPRGAGPLSPPRLLREHVHERLLDCRSHSQRAGPTASARPTDPRTGSPTLYFDDKAIDPYEAFAFYSVGIRDGSQVVPYPAGFRMIAGDAKARDKQIAPVVNWECAANQTVANGRSSSDSPRAQALRAVIARFGRAVTRHRKALRALRLKVKRNRLAIKRQRAKGLSATKSRRALARNLRALRAAPEGCSAARVPSAPIAGPRWTPSSTAVAHRSRRAPTPSLRLNVRFGDCWDGVNLDSSDHKSHVAYSKYSKSVDGWVCPKSHPRLLPILRLHVRYPTRGGPDIRLSPGDVDAGHADFFNGWDQEKLAQLVHDCLQADVNCGNGDVPIEGPAPKPSPSPSPSPSPLPQPSPTPEPEPEPDPGPSPLPLPGLP